MNTPRLELGEVEGASPYYEAPTAVVAEGSDQFPDLEAQGGGIEGVQGDVGENICRVVSGDIDVLDNLHPDLEAVRFDVGNLVAAEVPALQMQKQHHDNRGGRRKTKEEIRKNAGKHSKTERKKRVTAIKNRKI